MGAILDTRTLLTACRFSGAGLMTLGLVLAIGGVEEVLLMCRAIGTATIFVGAVVLALKLQGAGGAARLVGAVVAASGVLLIASDGPHRLGWALVGGCCAGIAFAARTEPRVMPFTDPVTLNWMLRRMLVAVLAGFAGLALLAALSATGAPRAIIALVLLSATGLCIVGLTATAMLLALPLRAIVAEAPRASPARFSGVQPLADLVAAAAASVAVLLASTRARGDDRPARAPGGDGRSERTRPSDP